MIVSVSEKSINVLVSHYICPSFRSVVIADDEGGSVLEKKGGSDCGGHRMTRLGKNFRMVWVVPEELDVDG